MIASAHWDFYINMTNDKRVSALKTELEVTKRVVAGKFRRCKREKSFLGSLVRGFMALAIAITGLNFMDKSLKESGVLNGNSH